MRTIKKTVLAFLAISLLAATGCKKDEKLPEPTPVTTTPTTTPKNYSEVRIYWVEVSSIPALNPIGNVSWDSTHDMDVYFSISNSSTTLFNGYNLCQYNKTFSEFPIRFSYATGWSDSPFVIYDLNNTFFVNVFDNDYYDTPSGTYDVCGVVGFDIQNYKATAPEQITGTFNNTTVTIYLDWIE